MPNSTFSSRHGKVDPINGKKGMVVSLDVEEYSRVAAQFGFPRIAGDDGPGELVQPFDEGTTWNVRWLNTGNLGNYYTGAYKLYHLRVGANNTDKTPLDLALRDLRQRIESGGISGPLGGGQIPKGGPTPPQQQTDRGLGFVQPPGAGAGTAPATGRAGRPPAGAGAVPPMAIP